MRTAFVVVVMLLLAALAESQQQTLPFVLYDTGAVDFPTAKQYCANRGAQLPSFYNSTVFAQFQAWRSTTPGLPGDMWTSATDGAPSSEGVWRWDYGTGPIFFLKATGCVAGAWCPVGWGTAAGAGNQPDNYLGNQNNMKYIPSSGSADDIQSTPYTADKIVCMVNVPATAAPTPIPTAIPTAVPTAIPTAAPPACACAGKKLSADYKNTLVPDAAKDAVTAIRLNTATWEVEFDVTDVKMLTNGHVIAAPVDARSTTVTAGITALVASPFETASLWNNPECGLSGIDTPAASLGVAITYNAAACTRSYRVTYSLIDAARRTTHCTLTNTAANEVLVECELQLNTIRAYDASEATAFLAKETVFRTNITMPRNLPNEVSTLLHASLAKCSVYAAPDFYVDCRIPALWNFAPTFTVAQSPSWIIGSSCAQTNGTDATYIRCDLQSISEIYTEAAATIGATVLPSGEVMNFAVNYSLARQQTATATGALTTFVKSIGTKDGKFFYGNDDQLTLEIEVVDTARLQITQLELFNSDSPAQSYNLRTTAQFETVEAQNATYFTIKFYPARMLADSNFYLHGPHGVNVSFLFTAARRQGSGAPTAGDQGVVTYSGIALRGPNPPAAQESSANSNASGLSQSVVAAIAGGALVAVVAVVAGTVMIVRRNKKAASPAKDSTEVVAQATAQEVDVADV